MLAVLDLEKIGTTVWGENSEPVYEITARVVMAGAVHLFTATNRAWRTRPSEAAGEFSRLGIGAAVQSLHESNGFDSGKIRARLLGRKGMSFGTQSSKMAFLAVRSSCSAASLAGSSTDAPSCIFVGPIETAEKARLEALYQQARDSYYSGQPLVLDAMFDKVEMELRWHGSQLVLKSPRCSLKRFTAYADAEFDPSQMRALAAVWGLLFALGFGLAVGLPTFVSHCSPHGIFVMSDFNRTFFSVASFLVGAPVVKAAVKQLQALRRGELVALKGCCPNCGGEVYTFVTPDYSLKATVHPSKSGQPRAHGRVYLPTRAIQLAPARPSS